MLPKRMVMTYLTLVGLPLLLLLAILEKGRALVAPSSIGGKWTVAIEGSPAGSCASAIAKLPDPAMSIAQSGTFAAITLGDSRRESVEAAISDGHLEGAAGHSSLAGACGPDGALKIQAAVSGPRGERRMEGRISFPGCGTCGEIAFRASRLAAAEKGAVK